jgi:hypothetical protein
VLQTRQLLAQPLPHLLQLCDSGQGGFWTLRAEFVCFELLAEGLGEYSKCKAVVILDIWKLGINGLELVVGHQIHELVGRHVAIVFGLVLLHVGEKGREEVGPYHGFLVGLHQIVGDKLFVEEGGIYQLRITNYCFFKTLGD